MDTLLQMFAAQPAALRPFLDFDAAARLYTLTPDADIALLPFDEAIQDAMHRRFGTGDWPPSQGMLLSTTDQAFAAECSRAAPLIYVECGAGSGGHFQSAAGWQMGRLAMSPVSLDLTGAAAARPRSLWPVNAALRFLGVRCDLDDEATAFGLAGLAANGDIHARGWPLRP